MVYGQCRALGSGDGGEGVVRQLAGLACVATGGQGQAEGEYGREAAFHDKFGLFRLN